MFDTTLKRTFQRPPNLLLSQALGEEVVVARTLPTDTILVETVQPDLIFETKDGRILHPELHGYPMKDFAVRNLIYFGLILRDYGQPPVQIVFWVRDSKAGITDGLTFPPMLHYRYIVIDVREMDGGPLLESPEVGESIFSVLCKHRDDRAAVARIVERIKELPREQWPEAVAELLVLSGLRDLTDVVKAEVERMPLTIDIQENAYLREVWREGEQTGIQEGRKEGIQEGRKEGIQEGRKEGIQEGLREGLEKGRRECRETLTAILEQKFGSLSDEVRNQLGSASIETLLRWTRRTVAARRLEDVFG